MISANDLDETNRMIRESVRAIAPANFDLSRVRACRFTELGYDRDVFRQMVDMGWLGLRLAESEGGLELGVGSYVALAETLGASLVPEPLVGAATALRLVGGLHETVLANGATVLAAWQDAPRSLEWRNGVSCADGRISGEKVYVQNGAGADRFVVPFAGGVAVVDRDAEGLDMTRLPTQDGGHFISLSFTGAPAEIHPAANVDVAIEEAILATAAYLFGLSERAFSITVEYLKVRKQFDRPIGSFQALQHRATDIKIQLELARAALHAAASTCDRSPLDDRVRAAVSQAKARISDVAMLIAKEAIQMHGAIGFTDEYDIGLYVRKAMTLSNLFGSAADHRRRYDILMPEAA